MAIAHVQTFQDKLSGADAFDAVMEADLRATGSLKWSAILRQLPAWVAEMDFGLASPVAERLHESVATAQVGYLDANRHLLVGLLQEHLPQAHWVMPRGVVCFMARARTGPQAMFRDRACPASAPCHISRARVLAANPRLPNRWLAAQSRACGHAGETR